MIVLGDTEHGEMIASAAGTTFDPRHDRCISRVTGDGQFLGGMIYTRFNGAAIWAHVAGTDGWLSPELVWVSFDYPFMQLRVNQILCSTSSRNDRALNLLKRLGFKQLYTIKDAAPDGGSMVLFSMSKPNCKWLKLRSRYLKANGRAGETIHAQL